MSGPGGVAGRPRLSGPKLLCQLKARVDVSSVTPDLQPFSSLPWAAQLPAKQLTSDLGPYKSCAVVSSAGSLRSSGLGREIGGHVFPNVPSEQREFEPLFPDDSFWRKRVTVDLQMFVRQQHSRLVITI